MRAPAVTIDRARAARRQMTPPEVIVWQGVRGGRLDGLRFRRQHPIGPYVLDFYCAAARLAVEIDGMGHNVPERVQSRRATHRVADRAGHQVLRISARDVLSPRERHYVFSTILAAARGLVSSPRRAPSTATRSPSPASRGRNPAARFASAFHPRVGWDRRAGPCAASPAPALSRPRARIAPTAGTHR